MTTKIILSKLSNNKLPTYLFAVKIESVPSLKLFRKPNLIILTVSINCHLHMGLIIWTIIPEEFQEEISVPFNKSPMLFMMGKARMKCQDRKVTKSQIKCVKKLTKTVSIKSNTNKPHSIKKMEILSVKISIIIIVERLLEFQPMSIKEGSQLSYFMAIIRVSKKYTLHLRR